MHNNICTQNLHFFKGDPSGDTSQEETKKIISGEYLIPPAARLKSKASEPHFQRIPELYIYMLHSTLPG